MFAPTGNPTRRWFATVVVILAIIAAVWLNQQQGLRSVTNDLAKQSLAQCFEIEGLKARVRDRVKEDYANLDRNGRLLGIPITPQIRAQARVDMETTLRRYSPDSCPRDKEG